MTAVSLFILGGMTLGFSLSFLFAPKQLSKRDMMNLHFGKKVKDKGFEAIINKIIYIDEKISQIGVTMALFLLCITVVLFWLGYTISK